MPEQVLTLTAAEFQERCPAIFEQLEHRELMRVVVTIHGRPVAELMPLGIDRVSPWGAHRGSVTVSPGVDLTKPALDGATDAESGILHNE